MLNFGQISKDEGKLGQETGRTSGLMSNVQHSKAHLQSKESHEYDTKQSFGSGDHPKVGFNQSFKYAYGPSAKR